MNRFTVVVIATLLFGCATTPRQNTAEKPAPITLRSWQQVQTVLQNAPPKLRESITQTGKARVPPAAQTESVNADAQEPRAVLVELLTHTSNPALLADAEFANLHHIVSGENPPLLQTYAKALANHLTQADFACQQPHYASYFNRRYAFDHGVPPCDSKVPFSVLNRYEGAQIVWLDPARVQSIHLLFASKSGSMASRFGHVALRLVVCPEGNTSSAACDANLAEHLVLGFRAHIDEFSLNTFKALNGDYKAYLFANHFMDVYEEYAIGEFREIYSLPLRLEGGQRAAMVRELADIHWSYAGSYSFFTRNCATMMQNALRVTWPELAQSNRMSSDYLRPDSLFEAIKADPLADAEKLASLEVAEREGYFFSSTREFYDRAVNEVRSAMAVPMFNDLESYLQIDPVQRRQDRAEDHPFMSRIEADQYLREAQIMLEEYAILRSERVILSEGAKYFEEQDFGARAERIRTQLDVEHAKVFDECLLLPITQQARPTQRLRGIPGQADIPESSERVSTCQSPQSKKLLHEVIAGIKNAESTQWQRVKDISQYHAESIINLNLLKQKTN